MFHVKRLTGKSILWIIHNVDTLAERARKCAVCGHEWVKRDGAEDPARCPNHKCRSTKWRGKQEANEPIED